MADLVSGRYGQSSPMSALFGNVKNETNPGLPGRSNAEFGIGQWVDGALAGVGVACAVAVPVDPGTTIKRITTWTGGTGASTPTHSWTALYSGIATPALLTGTQSTDGLTTAIAASGLWQTTVGGGTPYTVASADCPNGYIYVAIMIAGTGAQTAWGMTTPTAINYQGLTGSTTPAAVQPMYAATSGSSLTTTAAATLTLASKAVAPVVLLT